MKLTHTLLMSIRHLCTTAYLLFIIFIALLFIIFAKQYIKVSYEIMKNNFV